MINCLTVVLSVYFLVKICLVINAAAAATDSISVTKPLRYGETLVSSGGNFELGFFKPGNPNNHYVGVWYKKVSILTPVWVANRKTPLSDSSGILQITNHSTLVILNNTGHIFWSTNSIRSTLKNPIAQLLDTGNLVIRDEGDENPENFIWQSFDHPCDIHLPGMKQGRDLITGLDRHLTSWTSSDDPTPGNYTNRLDPQGYPQFVLKKGTIEQFRSGPWNGIRFSGVPGMNPNNPIYRYWMVINSNETYYTYKLLNSSVISHRVLNPYGTLHRVIWNEHIQGWVPYVTGQSDSCDTYALCGEFSSCNSGNSPQCGCLKGFEARNLKAWDTGDWSDGCVRRAPLACTRTDGFWKQSKVKLPDTRVSSFNVSMNLRECEEVCLKNCSCTAYSTLDIRDGESGCLLWLGDLVDIKEYTDYGQDLFIRLASSEIARLESANKKRKWIALGCTLLTAALLVGLGSILFVRKKQQGKMKGMGQLPGRDLKESDLPLLDFAAIAQATGNFSDENKLGQGGFGAVYKGTLQGGEDIAVKRLKKESTQGLDEFKNEVICIAKLQHRNLVKLLGCCIQAEERLLVYEYLPNKGLDSFIFEQARNTSLDWTTLLNIINGIARGLLYLHQDSRLRIVHRDLKASNVLLDHDLNPKISDFGTARCFHGNECVAETSTVIGTYGYMSPEYAIDGIFSVKSDVFSFGVLVLEIISGMRNRGFIHPDHQLNLLGHVWRLFQEGEPMKLISPMLNNVVNAPEIIRSIHVGLLCVQQRPEDRPSMSSVVVMLSSEGELPQPKQPGFFTERNLKENDTDSSKPESISTNEITITLLAGR